MVFELLDLVQGEYYMEYFEVLEYPIVVLLFAILTALVAESVFLLIFKQRAIQHLFFFPLWTSG